MVIVKNREDIVKDAHWRNLLLDTIEVAINSVDPYTLVEDQISSDLKSLIINLRGSLLIISFGKASISMAKAILDFISTIPLAPSTVQTLISSSIEWNKEQNNYLYEVEFFKGGHPFPTEESQKAASRALDLVQKASEDDLVICLVSGGGSALLAKPIDNLNLSEKKLLTSTLFQL